MKAALPSAPPFNEEALRRIEQQIEERGRHDLGEWERAGMDRRALLKLLALVAAPDHIAPGGHVWALRKMRSRQAELKSLAKRMKTLARDAQKLLDDPFSKIETWNSLHGGGLAIGRLQLTKWKDVASVPQALAGMASLAKTLADEQKKFGTYLRAFGGTDAAVVQLLINCWAARAQKMQEAQGRVSFRLDYLDELARLLTDAFECAGNPKTFSADGLRQTFRRRVRPLLAQWLSRQSPASTDH